MLPEKNCSDSARELAERQSNYLILSTLEQKLPPELFEQILTKVSHQKSVILSSFREAWACPAGFRGPETKVSPHLETSKWPRDTSTLAS